MKKLLSVLILVSAILALNGCGEKVSIDSGRVAKQLTTNGLESSIRRAGVFRLDSCVLTACPRFVILDAFENTKSIESKYYISKSKLDLTMVLDIQYAVKEDNDSINTVFGRVKSVPINGTRQSIITTEQVYMTYIKPTIIDTTRSALNDYDIDTIMDNLSDVRTYVEKAIIASYEDTPIIIKSVTFSLVSFPKVIVSKREEAASVEAEKITKLKRIEADMEVLKTKRLFDIENAQIAVEADAIVSKSMDEKMATWLMLQAMQTCASRESGDCHIDIHPSLLPILRK